MVRGYWHPEVPASPAVLHHPPGLEVLWSWLKRDRKSLVSGGPDEGSASPVMDKRHLPLRQDLVCVGSHQLQSAAATRCLSFHSVQLGPDPMYLLWPHTVSPIAYLSQPRPASAPIALLHRTCLGPGSTDSLPPSMTR